MRSAILIGRTRCGKTTLCQAMFGRKIVDAKTQAIEIVDTAIDTPGEYLENRRFHKALMVSSIEADVVVLLLDCSADEGMFSPGFASMFFGKPVWGVVSKIDLVSPERIAAAGEALVEAGAERIFRLSSLTGDGVAEFRDALSGGE